MINNYSSNNNIGILFSITYSFKHLLHFKIDFDSSYSNVALQPGQHSISINCLLSILHP